MAIEIENLTESLQKHLGLQQAQTVAAENMAADAIARMFGYRGDISRLAQLWTDEAGDVVAHWASHEKEFGASLDTLREVLERGFVTRRHKKTGPPSAFLPLAPVMITREKADTVYRQAGMSVVKGLWRDDPALLSALRERIQPWGEEHPLARLLVPLCRKIDFTEKGRPTSNLAEAINSDHELAAWIKRSVREDWDAWITASAQLSVDEQLESFVALIGLHLHLALLWRLREPHFIDGQSAPPLTFVSASVHDRLPECDRAGRNVFNWWSDRAHAALRSVASDAVDRIAQQSPVHQGVLSGGDWHSVKAWELPISGKAASVREAWRSILSGAIDQRLVDPRPMGSGEAREVVVDCLVRVFTRGNSSVVSKIRDVLRATGTAAGIVGPELSHARKRYLLSDGALELFARLHAARPTETIRSDHEEPQSVEALLDDLAQRYGIVITAERERARRAIDALSGGDALRVLRKRLPADDAMRENRAEFERRLDELRLLRRYSDASAVVFVPQGGR